MSKEKSIIIKFIRNIYIIDNLKTNLLIKIDILKLKDIIINFLIRTLSFRNIRIFLYSFKLSLIIIYVFIK